MNDLSQDAQRVLASYQATHASSGVREEDARARLQRAMMAERHPSGPMVNARFRRVRRAKLMFRMMRRAVLTGVFAFGVVWFLGPGMTEMSSAGLLEEARVHLDAKEYGEAYAVLAEHARTHPTKSNAERRLGMVLDALCGMDRKVRARILLEQYLELVPASEHADRDDDMCRGIEPVKAKPVAPSPDNGRRTPDWMPEDEHFHGR
jgi:hypothetical protein